MWILHIFLITGIASPTGVVLIIILTIMVICAMPFVRRSGHFQVFYFSHWLSVLYFVLLILHAPDYWKWVCVPLAIGTLEKLYRGISSFVGTGRSYIAEANVLASRYTLVILLIYNYTLYTLEEIKHYTIPLFME